MAKSLSLESAELDSKQNRTIDGDYKNASLLETTGKSELLTAFLLTGMHLGVEIKFYNQLLVDYPFQKLEGMKKIHYIRFTVYTKFNSIIPYSISRM